MSVIAVARRYAEALADVATDRNQVEQIDNEVRVFAEMMKSSRELHDTFGGVAGARADLASVMKRLLVIRDRSATN